MVWPHGFYCSISEYVILVWPYGFSLSWSTDDSTRQWWSGTESTKYRLTCQISTRLVHGRSPKLPTVSHFCLVRFCWFFSFGLFNTSQMLIFQRVWSCVDSPLLGVACYIENSMKEAWLLASFQCYATFSLSGGLAEMFSKVSDSIMWRLEVQYNTLLHCTDSPIESTSKSKQSFSEMCLRSMKWNNGVCPFCVLHFLVNFYFHIFPKIGSE